MRGLSTNDDNGFSVAPVLGRFIGGTFGGLGAAGLTPNAAEEAELRRENEQREIEQYGWMREVMLFLRRRGHTVFVESDGSYRYNRRLVSAGELCDIAARERRLAGVN